MLSITRSQRQSLEKSGVELPQVSPKKSVLMMQSNLFQLSQTSNTEKGPKQLHKSQQSLATLNNEKLLIDPILSPSTNSRHTIRLDRNQICSFFPNKRGMMQSQYLDITTQIKQLHYKEHNLMQTLNQIAFTITELKQYKSEKGLISQIEKLLNSHSRFQDLQFLFMESKMKDLTSGDALLKKIFSQFTFKQDNRILYKKNKPDQTFLLLLVDFLGKLEEQFRGVCESQFLGLQESMQTQRIKLQNKEIEVQNQLSRQDKKDSFYQLQKFLQTKTQINKRVLESNLCDNINYLEERNGKFKFIDQNNRFIANKIDDILKNIK